MAFLEYAIVGLGGAIGAMGRYGIQHIGIFDENKYCYTAGANITGCIAIGILWALLHYWNADKNWSLFLLTGVLGGYTTYSAFSLDTMLLLQNGMIWRALAYVAITLVCGLGGCALGLLVTERFLK